MTGEISNIVKDLVLSMDNTIFGTFDEDTGKTFFCNTKWARIGKEITNEGGDIYIITDIEPNEWILAEAVTGSNDLEGIIYLPEPYWITGTKLAANMEWTKANNNVLSKTPLIWLVELIRYSKFGRESTVDFESDLRLFFLDETNVAQYYTSDHRDNVVYPMEQLVNEFIEVIKANRSYETIESYEVITFSRFGVEQQNGMFKNILDANLSGVELRINLKKYKQNCKC
jgi:hypothetical protein